MKFGNTGWAIAGLVYLGILLTIMVLADFGRLPVNLLTQIPHYDLIGHFILYGIASFLTHRATDKKMIVIFDKPIPLGPFVFTLFTIFEEMLQSILPNRTCSLADLAASFIGIVVFYWLGQVWEKSHTE